MLGGVASKLTGFTNARFRGLVLFCEKTQQTKTRPLIMKAECPVYEGRQPSSRP